VHALSKLDTLLERLRPDRALARPAEPDHNPQRRCGSWLTQHLRPAARRATPVFVDLEPDTYSIWSDFGTGGVGLEIVNSSGDGFRTILDQHVALDFALRLAAGVMRLGGIP
jgi:hypothetical protein